MRRSARAAVAVVSARATSPSPPQAPVRVSRQRGVKLEATAPSPTAAADDAISAVKGESETPIKREISDDDGAWHALCTSQQLSCERTLASGQTFAWRRHAQLQQWSGVIGTRVFALRERDARVEFRCLHPREGARACVCDAQIDCK